MESIFSGIFLSKPKQPHPPAPTTSSQPLHGPEEGMLSHDQAALHNYSALINDWAENLASKDIVYLALAKQQIHDKIDHLPKKAERIAELIQALNERNWTHPLFDNTEEFPFYALAAVKEGQLSVEQFTTLTFFRMALLSQQGKSAVRAVPLFKNGLVNPVALHIVHQTMLISRNQKNAKPHLTQEQLLAYFERMKNKPVSEQYFFVIDDEPDPAGNKESVSRGINKTGLNVLCRFKENDKPMRMVPSFTMMQELLNTKFSHPIKLKPRIGVSSDETVFAHHQRNEHVVATSMPRFDLPETADTYLAKLFDFPYHDLYHAWLLSSILNEHRSSLANLVTVAEELNVSSTNQSIREFAKQLRKDTIDMEYSRYRTDIYPDLDSDVRFWMTVGQVVTRTINQIKSIPIYEHQTVFYAVLEKIKSLNYFKPQRINTDGLCSAASKIKEEALEKNPELLLVAALSEKSFKEMLMSMQFGYYLHEKFHN
jgi:hypothetical protein